MQQSHLLSLYEDETFDPTGQEAARTLALLDQLYEIAAVERGVIRTRWGVVDLALSLMLLEDEGTAPDPEAVMHFFTEFEGERRAGAAELSDLRSTVIGLAADEDITEDELQLPSIAPDMLSYLNAFTREGATEANVATRVGVMVSRLRHFLRAGG